MSLRSGVQTVSAMANDGDDSSALGVSDKWLLQDCTIVSEDAARFDREVRRLLQAPAFRWKAHTLVRSHDASSTCLDTACHLCDLSQPCAR
jgi:hypothetical protein